MRFINALSYKSADYLMRQMNGNHESRRVYYYGFQIVIGALFKGLLLLLLAFITGTMLSGFDDSSGICNTKVNCRGYHMKTYGKCIAASLGMIILAALISKYTAHMLNQISLIAIVVLSFVFSSASLIKWAPADNPNRPITDKKEIKKFRILSMIYIVIWLVLSLTLVYFKQKYVCAGTLPGSDFRSLFNNTCRNKIF